MDTRGSLCEKLVYQILSEEYTINRFQILMNLEYSSGQRVAGELDVVVIDKENDGDIVLVGEVKCKSDERKARSEARRQLQRFQAYIEDTKALAFEHQEQCKINLKNSGHQLLSFDCDSFSNTRYTYYHPKNKQAGPGDIDLSLAEIDHLLLKLKGAVKRLNLIPYFSRRLL